MKLLLTSNGLSNDTIARALKDLVGKEPKDSRIAFIPTAANPIREDKEWLIKDLNRIKQYGYQVDIVELTALNPAEVKSALEKADVIFVGGGNTFYLSYWMQKSGLFNVLPELLKTRVYAGISAGSMIAGVSLVIASQSLDHEGSMTDEDYNELGPEGQSSGKTLKFTDILFRPHLNSRFFPRVRGVALKERTKNIKAPVYVLDDQSALKIVNGKIEVISEGEWLLLGESGK